MAPATALLATALLSGWVGAGGLARLAEAAGPFAGLVLLAGLAEVGFLTVMLCHTGSGRPVPLAVMLGVATLPWTLGLLGTEVLLGRAVAGLAALDSLQARSALAAGTGRAMASRMLGAWMSSALLGGLALGLGVAKLLERRTGLVRCPRGRGLLLGSAVALALATVAVVGALEAHHLFHRLTGPTLAERTLLDAAGCDMAPLRPLRWGGLGLLAVLGLTLAHRRLRDRKAPPAMEWAGTLTLLAAVSALLLLDAHPLRSVAGDAQRMNQTSRKRLTTSATPSTTSITTPSEAR
ncbi:hypothetical protein P2318_03470 [Myxococcaceae bacterium GXIMD 01537]